MIHDSFNMNMAWEMHRKDAFYIT